jgi:hypothetical protein
MALADELDWPVEEHGPGGGSGLTADDQPAKSRSGRGRPAGRAAAQLTQPGSRPVPAGDSSRASWLSSSTDTPIHTSAGHGRSDARRASFDEIDHTALMDQLR